MSEPDDEWLDEDEDEAETWCIQCFKYCCPDELELLICQECRDSEIAREAIRKARGEQ